MTRLWLLLILFTYQVCLADSLILKSVTKKYKKSALVEITVEKTVVSELLGKETKFKGKIYLSSGLFRFENNEPEKTLLVYDGSILWNEQSPPAEFPGPVQVAKSKLSKKNKSQILISSLLGQGELNENFKIKAEKKMGDVVALTVEPKTSELNIKQLELKIIVKTKVVSELNYKDDVGNETKMIFLNTTFKSKKNDKLFKYVPPKDAQVTNL